MKSYIAIVTFLFAFAWIILAHENGDKKGLDDSDNGGFLFNRQRVKRAFIKVVHGPSDPRKEQGSGNRAGRDADTEERNGEQHSKILDKKEVKAVGGRIGAGNSP